MLLCARFCLFFFKKGWKNEAYLSYYIPIFPNSIFIGVIFVFMCNITQKKYRKVISLQKNNDPFFNFSSDIGQLSSIFGLAAKVLAVFYCRCHFHIVFFFSLFGFSSLGLFTSGNFSHFFFRWSNCRIFFVLFIRIFNAEAFLKTN